MRWVALTDENGFGLLAAAETTLEMSALHYTSSELDRRVHPYELHALEDTVLRLNAVQIGLGGDNSWSRIVTHEQYLPHDPAYAYSFVLAPPAARGGRRREERSAAQPPGGAIAGVPDFPISSA